MPVNRRVLTRKFSPDYPLPHWICPTCEVGILELQKKSLFSCKTSETILDEQQAVWDALDEQYRFTAMFKCSNNSCEEAFSTAGMGTYEEVLSDEVTQYELFFSPLYFNPSPVIIRIPPNCPKSISEELQKAFILSWGDYSSAANRVRASIEKLLDYLKVPKFPGNKRRKKDKLFLHKRIEKLPDKFNDIRNHLFAVKWLGNEGSHSGDFKRDDIFDAFDIIEHILESLFVKGGDKIAKLSKKINKAHGFPKALL